MTMPLDSSSPSEYVNVTKLINRYVATYTKGKDKTFRSDLFLDENLAKVAAETFAKENNLVYISKVDEEKRPVYTVIKYEGLWYPAELQKDKTILLTEHKAGLEGQRDLGGTKKEAIYTANLIAYLNKGLCFPIIGISISEKK